MLSALGCRRPADFVDVCITDDMKTPTERIFLEGNSSEKLSRFFIPVQVVYSCANEVRKALHTDQKEACYG